MSDRVSAGELRAKGIPIPEDIPNCATVPRDACRWKIENAAGDGALLSMDLVLHIDAPFEWVTGTFTIEDGHGKSDGSG